MSLFDDNHDWSVVIHFCLLGLCLFENSEGGRRLRVVLTLDPEGCALDIRLPPVLGLVNTTPCIRPQVLHTIGGRTLVGVPLASLSFTQLE